MVTAQIATPSQEGLAIAAPGFNLGVSAGYGLTLLRAAFCQDEANHGTARYPVDSDGLVEVPLEAIGPLTTVGGFFMAKARGDSVSAGALKLHHEDAAGCSYAGRRYLADVNGDVVVPAEAASELMAHGFVPVCAEAAASSGARSAHRNRCLKD